MTLEQKVHGLRLHVIQRAATLGNVSRACREAGISRALFYRWQQRRSSGSKRTPRYWTRRIPHWSV
jgi:hypothetical protein